METYYLVPDSPFLSTPWKIAAVAISVMLFLPIWMLAAMAYHFSNYPPIKSKGIDIIVAMMACDTALVFLQFITTQILDQTGIFFTSGVGCSTLMIVELILANTSFHLQTYRMYRLHFIVNLREPIHTFRFWLPFIIVSLPSLAYICLTIPPYNQFVYATPLNNPIQYGCDWKLKYYEIVGVLCTTAYASPMIFGLFVAYKLRQFSKALNESTEQISVYAWITITFIFYTIFTASGISSTIPGKLYNSLQQFIPILRIALILVEPVYGRIFHQDTYLKTWMEGMKKPKSEGSSKSKRRSTVNAHKSRVTNKKVIDGPSSPAAVFMNSRRE